MMGINLSSPARYICFILLIAYLTVGNRDAFTQTAEGDTAVSGWGVYPILFYTDQTSLALGGHAVHYFRNPTDEQTSTINTDLIYTLKKQLIVGGDTEIYKQNYRFNAAIWYQKFPDLFYGIGNDSKSEDEEKYTLETLQIGARLPYGITNHLFAGVLIDAQYQDFLELVPDGNFANSYLLGIDKAYWLTGAGFLAEWDSRDNVYYPSSGAYLRLWSIFYLPALGSAFDFKQLLLDLRQYVPITESTVLAFQSYLGAVTGNVPYSSYQVLGTTIFRGFSARYRDKTLLTFQGELRVKLWSRFGFVAFAGVGEVAPDMNSLQLSAFKTGAGIGIRFQAIPETGLNIRLDFGIGTQNNSSLTFYPGEAF